MLLNLNFVAINCFSIDDEALVEEVVVKVDEPEWPSISADSTQEMITPSIAPESSESSIQIDENSLQVPDVDSPIPLKPSMSQSDEFEQLTVEGSGLGMLSADSMPDLSSQSAIPDLDLMSEPEENNEALSPKPSGSEDSDSTDVLLELGELRFAEND